MPVFIEEAGIHHIPLGGGHTWLSKKRSLDQGESSIQILRSSIIPPANMGGGGRAHIFRLIIEETFFRSGRKQYTNFKSKFCLKPEALYISRSNKKLDVPTQRFLLVDYQESNKEKRIEKRPKIIQKKNSLLHFLS